MKLKGHGKERTVGRNDEGVRRRKMIEVASNRCKKKSDVWREESQNWRVTGRKEETAGR